MGVSLQNLEKQSHHALIELAVSHKDRFLALCYSYFI